MKPNRSHSPAATARRLLQLGCTFRVSERTIGPLVDLFIRITLAQIFFVSGVLKAANWDNALLLAAMSIR